MLNMFLLGLQYRTEVCGMDFLGDLCSGGFELI